MNVYDRDERSEVTLAILGDDATGSCRFTSCESPTQICNEQLPCLGFEVQGALADVLQSDEGGVNPYCYDLRVYVDNSCNDDAEPLGDPIIDITGAALGLEEGSCAFGGPIQSAGYFYLNSPEYLEAMESYDFEPGVVYWIQVHPYICCEGRNAGQEWLQDCQYGQNQAYFQIGEPEETVEAAFGWTVNGAPNAPLRDDDGTPGVIEDVNCDLNDLQELGPFSVGVAPVLLEGSATSSLVTVYEIDCSTGVIIELVGETDFLDDYANTISLNQLVNEDGECGVCGFFLDSDNTEGKCFKTVLTASNDCFSSTYEGCFTIREGCFNCLTLQPQDIFRLSNSGFGNLLLHVDLERNEVIAGSDAKVELIDVTGRTIYSRVLGSDAYLREEIPVTTFGHVTAKLTSSAGETISVSTIRR